MHHFGTMAVAEHGFDVAAVPADQSAHFGYGILTETSRDRAIGHVHDFHQVAALEFAIGSDDAGASEGFAFLSMPPTNIAISLLTRLPPFKKTVSATCSI